VPAGQETPESAQEQRAAVREARVRPEPRVRSEPAPSRNADVSAREDDEEAIEQPRPRAQARRAPRREIPDESAAVAVQRRPPTRLPPPIFVTPAAPRRVPDTANSGYGSVGGVSQAEGSPNAP
jgi:hypothetical protein